MILPVLGLALAGREGGARAAPPPADLPTIEAETTRSPEEIERNKAEAIVRFRKGNELFKEEAWSAALAELLASRRLYPTMNATRNAAVCLVQLKRYDEALALFEDLLREFSSPPADLKLEVQRAIVDLVGRVGTITVAGGLPGATLVVDGRFRGEFPPVEPLRVKEGSHVLRLYKQGFEPFETGVEVAGGRDVPISAKLSPLVVSGRLKVAERGGRKLDVVVDGYLVGETPWEGPIATGAHTILLQGNESLGSLPAPVTIKTGALTEITLDAEPLDATVEVLPVPATSSVALDGLFVGRGRWEGRLRPGAHEVKIVADGYFSETRPMTLERAAHGVVRVTLRKDPSSPRWRRPGRFSLELTGGALLFPSLGGDIAGACDAPCSRPVGAGGQVIFRGGYEMWNGFGFGVATGYLDATQTVKDRPATLSPVGRAVPDRGTLTDALRVRGFLAGAWAAYGFGERFPLRFRAGAGALVGKVTDTRTGSFSPSDPTITTPFSIGPVLESPGVAWFYLDPELRAGIRIGQHLELSAGVEAMLLFTLTAPRWNAAHAINAATDGYATFPDDRLTSTVLFGLLPGLGARYDF
ncbi:MAG: PEGA domain-containing protein [Byssovorax sp.]